MTSVLVIEGVEKTYRHGVKANDGVTLTAEAGQVYGVLGRVVILDEPTNDVDPVRRRQLWAQVRALAEGGAAVLLVTHNVVEAERSVDRLGILDHGRMIVEGTPAQLKESVSHDLRLELVFEPGVEAPPMAPFLRHVARNGHRITATVATTIAGEAAGWAQQLREHDRLEEFSLAPATLEDVYVDIVDRAEAERVEGGVAVERVKAGEAAHVGAA